MVTIEEKLNVFTKLVLEKAQNEFEEKLAQISKINEKRMDEAKEKLENEKNRIIHSLRDKGRAEKNKIISQAAFETKRKVLHKKQELIEQVMEDIKKKAEDFTEQETYGQFLQLSLEKALSPFQQERAITICMTQRDQEKYGHIILKKAGELGYNKEDIRLEVVSAEILGGFMVYNQSKTKKIDSSILAMIEENRKAIGQKVHDSLRETGESHG